MANILVVDDNRDIATPLIMFLEFEGHVVRYAENGKAGLAAINQKFPDLIILDVEMPVLDGPGMAYRLLVQDSGREHIPVIVLSGTADLHQVVARIGTPYYMRKPFGLDELKKLLDRALNDRQFPHPPPGTLNEAVP